MRMRRNRKQKMYLRNKQVEKDKELNTYTVYGEALPFLGEVWPAGGKVQAELYGERLSYIRNVKAEGEYWTATDRKGKVHYVYSDGLDITESDGVCIDVLPEAGQPDFKIISIKPYKPLRMEVEKL